MPIKPTYLNDELYDYYVDNFSCEDNFLINLKETAEKKYIPSIYITPEQGLYIQFLLKSINAKNVIEVGTLAGYSAIIMARALPEDGIVYSIEKNPEYADFARKMIANSDVADKIVVITSEAKKFFQSKDYLNYFTGEIDFAFVDANKPFYRFYLDYITPLLRKNGIFAADNAFAFGHIINTNPERNPNEIKSMRSFNNYFKQRNDYFVSLVPIGDGMIMGIKLIDD